MDDPSPGSPHIGPTIFVEGNKLDVVYTFFIFIQYHLWGMQTRKGNLFPHWKGFLVFFST